MTTTIELDSTPSMLGLYCRALTGGSARKSTAQLPQLAVALRGLKANQRNLSLYRKTCQFPVSGSLPITYPHILAFPLHMELLVADGFPFPLLGLVHVRNEIIQYRAIGNCESIDLECSLDNLRTVAKGKEFDILTQVQVNGKLAWESVSTMLYRCKTDIEEEKKAQQPLAQGLYQIPLLVKENMGRRYAAVSGDRNLIHLYGLTAKAFGFRKAIAHGMWTKARSLAALEQRLPEDPCKIAVQFKLPIFLPNRVLLEYDLNPVGVDFMVKNHTGEKPHLTGTISRY